MRSTGPRGSCCANQVLGLRALETPLCLRLTLLLPGHAKSPVLKCHLQARGPCAQKAHIPRWATRGWWPQAHTG